MFLEVLLTDLGHTCIVLGYMYCKVMIIFYFIIIIIIIFAYNLWGTQVSTCIYVIGLHAVQFGNNWMRKIPRTAKSDEAIGIFVCFLFCLEFVGTC